MYEKYINHRRPYAERVKECVFFALLVAFGLRFWLGPYEMHGPLDASLFAVFGLLILSSGDRFGLTKSRYLLARMLGWAISGVGGGALLIAAYNTLMTKTP
ncbi:hypothetical protein [uncultured Paludibaculum sp.]|uniref:hypothetical protein n=1 Tax=uncultured Paludibaculum sp. TaxID=1765020 RepID=UPI002AAACB9C|nr:hypothetical protein [uncultured Paludibaculum sp.]